MRLLAVVSLLSACGNDFTDGPIVVPNLNGTWTVSFTLGPSLDGSWTCTQTSQPTITISQIADLFTGTTTGGEAACQSQGGLSDVVSFDQYAILNGTIGQGGNLSFNWGTVEQVLIGTVSEDRLSIQGSYNLSLLLPPGTSFFFAGAWTATKD